MSFQCLESLLNPCTQLDSRLHTVLDPEVGSSPEHKYSVNRVAAKAAWYSPFVRWSRGGAITKSDGWRL